MTYEEPFSIRTDSIYRLGKHNREVLRELSKFLGDKGQWTGIRELYKIHKERSFIPGMRWPVDESIENPSHELLEENKELLFCMKNNGFHFGQPGVYKTHEGELEGVLLDQPYPVDKSDLNHKNQFFYFFAFMLTKIELPKEFLEFHLGKTYSNDANEYLLDLKQIQDDYSEIVKIRKRFLKQWITDNLKNRSQLVDQAAPPQNQSTEAKFFREAFKTPEGYNYIINELSKSEHGSWFDVNHNFIRKGRGNDHPSAVFTLLDILMDRHYLKEESKPNNNQTRVNFVIKAFGRHVGSNSSNVKGTDRQFMTLKFIKLQQKT